MIETRKHAQRALNTVGTRLRSRDISAEMHGRYLCADSLRIWWDRGAWVYDSGKGDDVPATLVPDAEDDLYQAIFSLLRLDREFTRPM